MKIKIIEKILTSGMFTVEEIEYILEKIIKEN
jgi:hypothetical protein